MNIPAHVLRGQEVIRENGLCGELSFDTTRICLRPTEHEGEHGDKDWPVNVLGAASSRNEILELLMEAGPIYGTDELVAAIEALFAQLEEERRAFRAYKEHVMRTAEKFVEEVRP